PIASSRSTEERSRLPVRGQTREAHSLCVFPCSPRSQPRRRRLAAPLHKSLRVLFVDDEKPLQEFMRTELPRLGHEVTVCPDGRSAVKVLEKSTFDAAVLDLRMPGMTGIEVLEQLKQMAPDTEAVVMTGHASM